MLSCRVLGKGIEEVFIRYVLNNLRRAGTRNVRALYLMTEKNIQVQNFYDKIGFQLEEVDGEQKKYTADLEELNLEILDIYKIVEK